MEAGERPPGLGCSDLLQLLWKGRRQVRWTFCGLLSEGPGQCLLLRASSTVTVVAKREKGAEREREREECAVDVLVGLAPAVLPLDIGIQLVGCAI